MNKIIKIKNIILNEEATNADQWTAIIPAAGKGSRLGHDKPKILYPILDKSILQHIIETISEHCSRFIFILSKEGEQLVRDELQKIIPGKFEIVIQETPRGMADAILKAEKSTKTKNSLVIWGDQVTVKRKTIASAIQIHNSRKNPLLTLPTVLKTKPYIHFERNQNQTITHVFQARESSNIVKNGESDIGVFLFDTKELFKILNEYKNSDVAIGESTQEYNLLPLIPKFENESDGLVSIQIEDEFESIGVNTKEDVQKIEEFMKEQNFVNVVVFSGGRGTETICKSLFQHPQIKLKVLVNAYDDGLSTGAMRRFIPGLLGPSDFRKNISRFIDTNIPSGKALYTLFEIRLPLQTSFDEGIFLLNNFLNYDALEKFPKIADAIKNLKVETANYLNDYCKLFSSYAMEQAANNNLFDFNDCSFGNILFAGCYLKENQNFNQTVSKLSEVANIKCDVINITDGQNLVLTGLKEDGTYLIDEAQIVSPQNSSSIKDIFLLENYLNPEELDKIQSMTLEQKHSYLTSKQVFPELNQEVVPVIKNADIVIYGPGTQHSSLFPSYITKDLGELIASNKASQKIFISNILKDNEIQNETVSSLTQKLLFYMKRKNSIELEWKDIISTFFIQTSSLENAKSDNASYVTFDQDAFPYAKNNVNLLDWESASGAHSGDQVLAELTSIVNNKLSKKINRKNFKVSIVVPALNEEKTLKQVLHDLDLLNFMDMGLLKEIIFVDGGSTDHSYEIAKENKNVKSLKLPVGEFGRGAALRHGIKNATGDIIAFFPSDAEYDTKDLIHLIKTLNNNENSVVFGSRTVKCINLDLQIKEVYNNKFKDYFVSKYGGMLLSSISLFLYNRFVTDPLTSLKVFKKDLIDDLNLKSSGFDLDGEIIAKLGRKRVFINEIPVKYSPRTKKDGKKITMLDGIKCIINLLKFKYSEI
ncbi:hypothetical protein M899_1411 [Bacteriovorax sp. BSW11_IV]|uniref:glycosyltransferase n=1 Tax=Bacteriovorax sp. BSW11_IV TaxID=1353529 RepID=UPI000389E414|nr:glycosyltransferase [Bacteriovorax sp. BSW11_IV]EQC45939.1 hypothetical protein M899_1411 [Bacteriovorax sp. BSW11_IV]